MPVSGAHFVRLIPSLSSHKSFMRGGVREWGCNADPEHHPLNPPPLLGECHQSRQWAICGASRSRCLRSLAKTSDQKQIRSNEFALLSLGLISEHLFAATQTTELRERRQKPVLLDIGRAGMKSL